MGRIDTDLHFINQAPFIQVVDEHSTAEQTECQIVVAIYLSKHIGLGLKLGQHILCNDTAFRESLFGFYILTNALHC